MRLWNGWGNEDSDLTMELSDGLRSLLEALVGPGTALSQANFDHAHDELVFLARFLLTDGHQGANWEL